MGTREIGQGNLRWYRRTDRGARGPLCAFMPLATVFLCQLIMLQSVPATWEWMTAQPWAVVVTYVVLLLVQILLERLTTSLLAGVLCTMVPCFLLAIASHLKLAVNGVPLLFSDLAMIGQAAQIAGFLGPDAELGKSTWLALFLALGLLFLVFLWDRPVVRVLWWQRLFTAGAMAVVLATVLTLPAMGTLLDDREEGESQAMRNDRLGVLAGMYAAARHNTLVEPDEYNEDNMNRILLEIGVNAQRVATPEVKPNVVVLLSESFFDPTRLPNVTYTSDPLPNYHALAREYPAGDFYTCAFSGGTGVAEMEIMTGVSTNLLQGEEIIVTISSPGAYERIPSLVRAFAAQGYRSTYVHSHTNDLYGRKEHLPAIGFEHVFYREDFTTELRYNTHTYNGDYVSDDCWADELIAQFEAKEEGQPIFLFGMSMENHMPFSATKYDDPSPVGFQSDLITEEADVGVFDSLLHGLYNADAALGKLIDYFSKVEEPTIVVFMGDHLPSPNFNLEESDTLFSRLGCVPTAVTTDWTPEEMKTMLHTNYLVWNNYGAQFDVPEELSTTSVGSCLLDWAGLPKPLYYTWVDMVQKKMLLYRDRFFLDVEGNPYSEIPEAYEAIMNRYRTIIYDTLYGENFITEALTGSRVRKTVVDNMPEVVPPDGVGEPAYAPDPVGTESRESGDPGGTEGEGSRL